MPNLNEQPAYRGFIAKRDKALEVFHNKTQRFISDQLRQAFSRSLGLIQTCHTTLVSDQNKLLAPRMISQLDGEIEGIFIEYLEDITEAVRVMRRNAYVMANAGEVEAIGRSMGVEQTANVTDELATAEERKPTEAGGDLLLRVKLYMDRMRRKIIDAVQLGTVNQDNRKTFMTRVYRSLPSQKAFKRPPRQLKKVKEARTKNPMQVTRFGQGQGRKTPVAGVSMTVGNVDQQTWDFMVDDYLEEYIPKHRGPESVIDLETIAVPSRTRAGRIPPVDEERWYVWELERDINQEFVNSVRSGQIAAAQDNGITDFVWISIIDSITDTCCVWRDGLTTKEIEQKLKSSKANDKCKAVTPPAHFKCRCAMAPATKEIPGKPATNLGDFDKWLTNP